MTRPTAMPRQRLSPRGVRRVTALLAVMATGASLALTAPADAASSTQLKVSSLSNRSAAVSLDGAKVTGRVYVFLTPSTNLKQVAFYLDDPKHLHAARHLDTEGPFDLVGGTAATGLPWSTLSLSDGEHSLTAVVTSNTGHQTTITATFDASNPTPKPTAVAAKAGNNRVTLTWASGGGATTGFNIYRSTSLAVSYKDPVNAATLDKTKSSYVDGSARNGVKYYYVVRAVSTLHDPASGAKVIAQPLAPPSTPKSVAATSADSKITITWANSGGPVSSWLIYRGPTANVSTTTPLVTLGASALSYTDSGLTNGTTYYYVVRAVANSYSASASAVPGTPIPAPDTLTGIADNGKVTVGWNIGAGSTAITGFRVYVGTTSAVHTTGTPAASISDATKRSVLVTRDAAGHALVNGTKYYFRVVSISATGKAPSYSSVGATPVLPPVAPTALTATASSGQILLTWVASGTNTMGYNVFRANGSSVPSTSGTPVNPSLLDLTANSYADVSVSANTMYTYVVVAGGPSHVAPSPSASATTPSLSYGPSATGWGGSLTPTNLDWTPGPIKTALGTTLTDYRYVFNRIGTTNIDKTATLHVKPCADLTLTNHGGSAVNINSLTVSGPYELVYSAIAEGCPGGTAISFPHTLASGASIKIEMRFDYCRTTCPSTAVKGVQYGVLTINSNDPGHNVSTLPLAGAWQATAGGPDELPLTTFVNQVLGITTQLTGGSGPYGYKGINYGNGLVAAVCQEVLSPYWRATGSTVSVRQVIATHAAGGHEPLQWFNQGNSGATNNFLTQAGTDYQTLLPGGSNGPRAEATFNSPGGAFGFRVNSGNTADWSDDTLNQGPTLANDIRHGCPGPCGHHVRFYPLHDPNGSTGNTYLMVVDSQGVNLDFNDVDYIISGITPA